MTFRPSIASARLFSPWQAAFSLPFFLPSLGPVICLKPNWSRQQLVAGLFDKKAAFDAAMISDFRATRQSASFLLQLACQLIRFCSDILLWKKRSYWLAINERKILALHCTDVISQNPEARCHNFRQRNTGVSPKRKHVSPSAPTKKLKLFYVRQTGN